VQVLAAMAGVLVGQFAPGTGEALKPLGDLFIRLVKMVIAPVIFLTIVTGIAGCAIWDRSAAWRARPLPISSPFPRWR
jgi:Na+/H+-dicarboxylate symporter